MESWVWHEAPLDEFAADICPPDGMELELQPLIARPEEYVFRTSPLLDVSGKVVDAVTKAPIKRFRVVTGFRSTEKEMHYARGENYIASDGHYRLKRDRADFDIVRIEADGYQPANSRDIKSDEGTISIDFALIAGKMSPDGFSPRKTCRPRVRMWRSAWLDLKSRSQTASSKIHLSTLRARPLTTPAVFISLRKTRTFRS